MKTAGKTLDDEEAQAILKDVQGIGTSATRANVLDILKKRGYLVTERISYTSVKPELLYVKRSNSNPC